MSHCYWSHCGSGPAGHRVSSPFSLPLLPSHLSLFSLYPNPSLVASLRSPSTPFLLFFSHPRSPFMSLNSLSPPLLLASPLSLPLRSWPQLSIKPASPNRISQLSLSRWVPACRSASEVRCTQSSIPCSGLMLHQSSDAEKGSGRRQWLVSRVQHPSLLHSASLCRYATKVHCVANGMSRWDALGVCVG